MLGLGCSFNCCWKELESRTEQVLALHLPGLRRAGLPLTGPRLGHRGPSRHLGKAGLFWAVPSWSQCSWPGM